jgi:hypothetical protein
LAPRDASFLEGLIEDGRPLLLLTAVALLLSGAFAIFLAARREFLPHDIAYLGMSADELCLIADCRVVRFMFHDRVAFGGALIAIAVLYAWLIAFPLRGGAQWAWWALTISGVLGFASFLAYLGYGYLDTWHGAATLVLLPTFLLGLWRTRPLATQATPGWLRSPDGRVAPVMSRVGRWGLIGTGAGMVAAGLVILGVGATRVFVPEDLAFMGLTQSTLDQVNPRLIPLIAHDRAGFGGGLASAGVLVTICAWYGPPSRAFYQAMLLAGAAGFGCAIGVHYVEGYTNLVHLAPAFAGAGLFASSLALEIGGIRRKGVPAPAAV